MRLLGIALGLALWFIAAGAALWPGVLTLPGLAATNDIEAAWISQECTEILDIGSATSGEFEGVDAGDFQVSGVDSHVITLSLSNSYPGHTVRCEFEWINSGQLVARAQTIRLSPGPGLANCVIAGNVLSCSELTVTFDGGDNACQDAGEPQTLTLTAQTEQPAAENDLMAFGLEIEIVQCVQEYSGVTVVPPAPGGGGGGGAAPGGPAGQPEAPAPVPTRIAEVGGARQLPAAGLGFEEPDGSNRPAIAGLLLVGAGLIGLSLWTIVRSRWAADRQSGGSSGQGGIQ